MRTLTLDEDDYSIPGEWNELTPDQLIYLIRMIKNRVTPEEVKLKILLYCMSATIRKFEHTSTGYNYIIQVGRKKYPLTSPQVHAICEIFNYLFIEENGAVRINPLLTKNPFPQAKCGCITVYGPQDGLIDLTYQQFADLAVWQTQLDKSDKALDKFISIIYKRQKSEASPNLIAKMSPTVKEAIVWFYMGCLQFIQTRFPKPFEGGEGSSNVFDGMQRIIDALAHNDVTKKEQVKKSLLYDALYTMQCAAEQVEKIQKK